MNAAAALDAPRFVFAEAGTPRAQWWIGRASALLFQLSEARHSTVAFILGFNWALLEVSLDVRGELGV
eukprot:7201318-Alexandrium_andersonii.AAC.1